MKLTAKQVNYIVDTQKKNGVKKLRQAKTELEDKNVDKAEILFNQAELYFHSAESVLKN